MRYGCTYAKRESFVSSVLEAVSRNTRGSPFSAPDHIDLDLQTWTMRKHPPGANDVVRHLDALALHVVHLKVADLVDGLLVAHALGP